MHYANGREARIGDLVVGRVYNLSAQVCGTLVSLTPGIDSCSCKVGFLLVVLRTERDVQAPTPIPCVAHVKTQGTQQHGFAGVAADTYYCEDFTHCANLLHADDVLVPKLTR